MPKLFEVRPWSLVILLSGFLMKAIVHGIAFSIGLYTVEFLKYFDTTAANASLVGAVNLCVFRMSGPLVSLLLKKFSYMTVAVTGGLLSCLGTLSVVFVRDITGICFTYGLIAGAGFCTCDFLPSLMVGVYFKRKRSIANAIIECGSQVGTASMPFLITQLIEDYTWRGSFYIISCFTAQLIVLGALLRTPAQSTINRQNKTRNNELFERTVTRDSSVVENKGEMPTVSSVCRNMSISSNIQNSKNAPFNPVCTHIHLDQSESAANKYQLPTKHKTLRQLPSHNKLMSNGMLARIKNNTHKYFKVFRNPGFCLYTSTLVLFCFTIGTLTNFFPKFILSLGLTTADAARFQAIRSFAAIISIIPSGFLITSNYINAIVLYITANVAFGVPSILLTYFHSYHSIVTFVIIQGVANGVIKSANVIIILDLVGTEHAADAIGFSLFAMAIGLLAGPPVTGYLYDATKGFDAMLYCLFAVQCLVGFIMACYIIQRKCCAVKWWLHKTQKKSVSPTNKSLRTEQHDRLLS